MIGELQDILDRWEKNIKYLDSKYSELDNEEKGELHQLQKCYREIQKSVYKELTKAT